MAYEAMLMALNAISDADGPKHQPDGVKRHTDGIRYHANGALLYYGSKHNDKETLNYTLTNELGSERSEQASERMSAAEHGSKVSSAEQANE